MEVNPLPTPTDYPWILGFVVALLGILGGFVWFGLKKVGTFLTDLIAKLEKRVDDERARADIERDKADARDAEAVKRWQLAEQSKQDRGDRLDARITESNNELAKLITESADETNRRIAATEKTAIDHHHRLHRLEEHLKINPPKEGG